jgi:phage-related protein
VTENFKVKFLEEASEFLDNIDEKAKEKVIYNIHKAQVINDKSLFRKLSGETWEFRTLFNKAYYRLFAFWDKFDSNNTIVISTHGIIKKTDKTPRKEIEKAERLRLQYFKQKKSKQ